MKEIVILSILMGLEQTHQRKKVKICNLSHIITKQWPQKETLRTQPRVTSIEPYGTANETTSFNLIAAWPLEQRQNITHEEL